MKALEVKVARKQIINTVETYYVLDDSDQHLKAQVGSGDHDPVVVNTNVEESFDIISVKELKDI